MHVVARRGGAGDAAWLDGTSRVFGSRHDPASHAWSPPVQVTLAGIRSSVGVALDASRAVILATEYASSQYEMVAYPVDVP